MNQPPINQCVVCGRKVVIPNRLFKFSCIGLNVHPANAPKHIKTEPGKVYAYAHEECTEDNPEASL